VFDLLLNWKKIKTLFTALGHFFIPVGP